MGENMGVIMKTTINIDIDAEEIKGMIKDFVESKYGKVDKVRMSFYRDNDGELTHVEVGFEEPIKNENYKELICTDALVNTVDDLLLRMRDVEENVKTASEWTIKGIQAVTNKSDELVKRVDDIEYDEEACDKAVEVLEKRVEELVKEVGQGNQIVEGHSTVITKLAVRVGALESKVVNDLAKRVDKLEKANPFHFNKDTQVIDVANEAKKKLFLNGWKMNGSGYFSHEKIPGGDCTLRVAMEIQEEWENIDRCAGCIKDTKENMHSVYCQNCAADQFISYNKGEGEELEELKAMEKGDEKEDRLHKAGWRMSLCGWWIHDSKKAINLSYQEAHKTQDIWDKEDEAKRKRLLDNRWHYDSFTQRWIHVKVENSINGGWKYLSFIDAFNEQVKWDEDKAKEERLYKAGWMKNGELYRSLRFSSCYYSLEDAIKVQNKRDAKNDHVEFVESISKKQEEDEAYLTANGWNKIDKEWTKSGENEWFYRLKDKPCSRLDAIKIQNERDAKNEAYLTSNGWNKECGNKWVHPKVWGSSTLEGAVNMQKAFENRDKIREGKKASGKGWGVEVT
jgi:hypothetical protein